MTHSQVLSWFINHYSLQGIFIAYIGLNNCGQYSVNGFSREDFDHTVNSISSWCIMDTIKMLRFKRRYASHFPRCKGLLLFSELSRKWARFVYNYVEYHDDYIKVGDYLKSSENNCGKIVNISKNLQFVTTQISESMTYTLPIYHIKQKNHLPFNPSNGQFIIKYRNKIIV